MGAGELWEESEIGAKPPSLPPLIPTLRSLISSFHCSPLPFYHSNFLLFRIKYTMPLLDRGLRIQQKAKVIRTLLHSFVVIALRHLHRILLSA